MPVVNQRSRQRSPRPEIRGDAPPSTLVPRCGQPVGGRCLTCENATAAGAYPLRTPCGDPPQEDVWGYAPASLFGPMLRTWLAKEVIAMSPIHIPPEWDDNDVLYFEEFCTFVRTPQRTARDWKRRGIGPRWWRINGNGRLYTTVAELRRFLAAGRRRESRMSDTAMKQRR